MAARAGLGVKASETLTAVVLPSPRSAALRADGLAGSPRSSGAEPTTTLLHRMRAVLKRHQCVSEEEAASVCLRQAGAAAVQPSVVTAAGPCSAYMNSLRYCQQLAVQHNYPVAPAFLN